MTNLLGCFALGKLLCPLAQQDPRQPNRLDFAVV